MDSGFEIEHNIQPQPGSIPAGHSPPPQPPPRQLSAAAQQGQELLGVSHTETPSNVVATTPPPRPDSPRLERLTRRLSALADRATQQVGIALRRLSSGPGLQERLAPPEQRPASPADVRRANALNAGAERTSLGDAYVPELRDEDFPQGNSRYDFVRFGNSITEAGGAALTGVMIDAMNVLNEHPQLSERMGTTVDSLYRASMGEINELQRTLPINPNICGLDPDTLSHLQDAHLEQKAVAEQSLHEALSSKITGSPNDAKAIRTAKHELQGAERFCERASLAFLEELKEAVQNDPNLSPSEKEAIVKELTQIGKEVRVRVGRAREDILHNQAEWTTPNQEYRFDTLARDGSHIQGASLFTPAGPAKSSSCARNQPTDQAIVPNFFRTMLRLPGRENALCATRSAISVEFGVNDPAERMATTIENEKKILEVHAKDALERNAGAGMSADKPLELDYQHVMLLTPDMSRHILHSMGQFSPKSVFRADDERLLVEENIRANEHLNGQVMEVQIGGQTRYVKFNISTFNIPSNRLHQKLTYSAKGAGRLLRRHKMTDNANLVAFESMTEKYNKVVNDKTNEVVDLVHSAPPEIGNGLIRLQRDKRRIRQQMTDQYILKGKPVPAELLHEYSLHADGLANLIKGLSQDDSTRGLAQAFQEYEELRDLHADLNEMIQTKAYNHAEVLDGNRYAIGSRIIALGQRLEIATHFGCRSGKDRTGLQDEDVKQLEAEIVAEGRVPSYLEAEKWDSHIENQHKMLKTSGNGIFNTIANIGIQAWGIGGGRRQGTRIVEQDYFDVIGTAGVYFRPASQIPPASPVHARNRKIKSMISHTLLPGVLAIKHKHESIKKERVKKRELDEFRGRIRIPSQPPPPEAAAA